VGLLVIFSLRTSYFILHTPSAFALEGVGAQVKEVSEGRSIVVTGRHAPLSQVLVAYGDEVVSAVLDEGQGDFTFTFEADNPKVAFLVMFAIEYFLFKPVERRLTRWRTGVPGLQWAQ
jgi:hypothetical protein